MAFGNFDNNNNRPLMSEINTTPLVDVMLVLLIIFIVTAPLLTNNINIDLPSAKTNVTPEKNNIINVAIDDKGNIFFNSKLINQDQLPQLLAQAKEGKQGETEMHLRADKNTRYQQITEVMAQAQKAGISKLGFVNKVER